MSDTTKTSVLSCAPDTATPRPTGTALTVVRQVLPQINLDDILSAA